MKTDTLFYRFFQELPECFFALVGRPASDVSRFRFEAIELKDTVVRIDGVYSPVPPDESVPVYFVEFQNYRSERTYSNLFLKVGLFLEKVNPRQNWHAVVIYPSRSLEQENLHPYRCWLHSDQLMRVYLDDIPEPAPEEVGLRILRLIVAKPEAASAAAPNLISQVRHSTESTERQANLIELIVTIIAYQRPQLSRKELEQMLQVNDFRETKVYQEALEEGIEKGIEEGIEKGIEEGIEKGIEEGIEKGKAEVAVRMLAEKFSLAQVAKATGLSPAAIKRLKRKPRK